MYENTLTPQLRPECQFSRRRAKVGLAGRKFVAGDQLTIGDIAFGPVVYLVQNVPFDRPKLANYDAWYARLSERPAFKKVVALPVA